MLLTSFNTTHQAANLASNSSRAEPTVQVSSSTRDMDVSNLLRWLGAQPDRNAFSERGIMKLEDTGNWTPAFPDSNTNLTSLSPYFLSNPMIVPITLDIKTITACLWWGGSSMGAVAVNSHPIYVAVIQAILQRTGRPALVMEAFWTMHYQSYYYDNLNSFDVFANATLTTWLSVLMPVHWTGYTTICALVAAHHVLLGVVTWCFLTKTKYSQNRCYGTKPLYILTVAPT